MSDVINLTITEEVEVFNITVSGDENFQIVLSEVALVDPRVDAARVAAEAAKASAEAAASAANSAVLSIGPVVEAEVQNEVAQVALMYALVF